MTLDDLYRLLKAGHVQAQGIVDTIQVPLVVLDGHLTVVHVNPSFLETFGVSKDETMGVSLLHLGNGQWNNPELELLLRRIIPKASVIVGYEITHEFPHVGRRTMLVSARRLLNPDSSAPMILVVFEDVTDQRAQAVQQDIVAAEIRHRFKNFLTLVASLARQSPASGVSVEEYRDTLLGRINALAEAELTVFGHEPTDIESLLERLMSPYGERVVIGTCAATKLEGRQAASLSMLLHELATNAAKHGCLSVDKGQVHLEPTISGGAQPLVRLVWREVGGPAPSASDHKGFGSRLIQMIASQQLGGSATMDFTPQGLVATVSFPLARA